MTRWKLAGAAAMAASALGVFTATVTYALSNRRPEPATIIRGLGGVPTMVQRVPTSSHEARTTEPLLLGEYVEIMCTSPAHMKLGDEKVQASYEDKLVAANTPVIYNLGESRYLSFISPEKGYCWVTALR